MQPIYYIDLNAKACEVEVYVNGFPAMRLDSENYANNAQAISHYLVGRGNDVKIVLIPSEVNEHSTDQSSIIKEIKCNGSIKIYQPGDVSSPKGGKILKEFNFDGTLGGAFKFDNDLHDFSGLFLRNEKIKNTDLIKEYGLYLFDLAGNDNMEALSKEFRPKMKDYARAFFLDETSTFYQFRSFLVDEFFKFPPHKTKVLPEEVYVRSYCDDRVFEIGLLPNEPLLRRFADENQGDMEFQMSVYVAAVDKQLKVVR